jgi:hypothetical protein
MFDMIQKDIQTSYFLKTENNNLIEFYLDFPKIKKCTKKEEGFFQWILYISLVLIH